MKEFKKNFKVQTAETDCNHNFKVYSFMCEAQEAANDHASILNFGYKQLIDNNNAWVLSRLKAKFVKPPKWEDNVTMRTWHKGLDGVFSIRDFILESSDGAPLVYATSSWLIINLESRRILRIERIVGDSIFTSANPANAMENVCDKLISPSDMTHCGERKVLFSDIDSNQHVNNAKYMEWATDFIDPQILISHEIDEYQINFNHETRLGEMVNFYISSPSCLEYFIEGRGEKTVSFQAIIKLKP